MEGCKDCHLKANARIWPSLPYMCHIRSTAFLVLTFPGMGSLPEQGLGTLLHKMCPAEETVGGLAVRPGLILLHKLPTSSKVTNY